MITDIGNRYGPAPVRSGGGIVVLDLASAGADAIAVNVTAAITSLSLVNGVAGQRVLLILTQTGAGAFNITFASSVKGAGAITGPATGHASTVDLYVVGNGTYIETGRVADVNLA